MFQADEGIIDFLSEQFINSNEQRNFFRALRSVITQTDGLGMTKVAEYSGLNRENLYRMVADDGNPGISNFRQLLRSLGMDLSLIKYTPPPKDHSLESKDKAGFKTRSLFSLVEDAEDDIFAE